MNVWFYVISTSVVFVFSGLLAMAGLGAAFLFVPFFYYMGLPLSEATPIALLLNVVSLFMAAVNYGRARLINFRMGIPIMLAAVISAPLGARLTPYVARDILLALFAAFLVFAGFMMLFYSPQPRQKPLISWVEVGVGIGIGIVAGFLGGLLGVGGGNFILPVLAWMGLDPKIAAGTTAMIVVFSSFSGFLGHVSLGGLEPRFLAIMALAAGGGSLVGSNWMKTRLSSQQLKRIIGVLLWLIALKMVFDLIF